MSSHVCDEAVREFLVESHENLDQLDREFLALEAEPNAPERVAVIFRTIHTIKGTSGFLGYGQLEAITHVGENLLSKLRDGVLTLNPEMTSALLALVDCVRKFLGNIEATGNEGVENCSALAERLAGFSQPAPENASPPQAPAAIAPRTPNKKGAIAPASETVKSIVGAPVAIALGTASLEGRNITADSAEAPSKEPPENDNATQGASTAPTHAAEVPAAAMASSNIADTNVRVDVDLLDRLMNLVGELVLARNQILQAGAGLEDAAFAGASQRLNLITTELQEGVMKTRMQPIGNVWNKLPRVVRDLAISCGKQVRAEMVGKETELDRTIIEAIKDPLTHIVRNAIDHGIESPDVRAARGKARTGTLILRAFHEGGQVNIEISDDGGGMEIGAIRKKAIQSGVISAERIERMSERELYQLVFLPGFSTAAKVTNVSGRGVGMDVVKTNIEKIGGTVELQSQLGQGTTIRIKIPLTLAIIPALIVMSRGHRFAIPQISLLELVRLEAIQIAKGIEHIHGAPVYRLRGDLLPLVHLGRALDLQRIGASAGKAEGEETANIVVLRADDRQFGLIVDEVRDTEEIVVKPLGKELKSNPVLSGATIMGDGRVALILDVLGLAHHSGAVNGTKEPAHTKRHGSDHSSRPAEARRQTLLLFRAGAEGRMAIPLSWVARLEEFPVDLVECSGNRRVVQYREQILPLIELALVLGEASSAPLDTKGSVSVIVYSECGRSIGLVVDDILDTVEDITEVSEHFSRPGVFGSAVLQGKVTELLDVKSLILAYDPGFFDRSAA